MRAEFKFRFFFCHCSKGPRGVVHKPGQFERLNDISSALMESLRPLRLEDPAPLTTRPPPPPPRNALEREHRFMKKYTEIFRSSKPVLPPSGLWAAGSQVNAVRPCA